MQQWIPASLDLKFHRTLFDHDGLDVVLAPAAPSYISKKIPSLIYKNLIENWDHPKFFVSTIEVFLLITIPNHPRAQRKFDLKNDFIKLIGNLPISGLENLISISYLLM